MPLPSIIDPDGRRYWAFLVILGGCFVFTMLAAIGVYLVKGNAYYSLVLALAAHAQLFVGMGAFSFVLGRRMRFKGGKDGVEFDDTGQIAGAEKVAAAAEKKVEQIKQQVQDERG